MNSLSFDNEEYVNDELNKKVHSLHGIILI